jgi:hypothetical protein
MVIFVVISCFFRLSPASFPELVLTIHKKTQPCFEFLWQKYANIPWQQSESIQISPNQKKQDAAHEPECSHVEHFCEQVI